MSARHLRLVDVDSGEWVADTDVAQLQERIEDLEGKLKDAELELRVKRAMITRLKRDMARERVEYERYDDVKRIAVFWWRLVAKSSPKVNPMTPERFDAVRGILDLKTFELDERGRRRYAPLHPLEDFEQAIRGAHFDPFVTVRKNGSRKRHDDLALICRDEGRFREFMAKAPPRAKRWAPGGWELLLRG